LKVDAKYHPGGRGSRRVVGRKTGTEYGIRSEGDVFPVEAADIAASPSQWLCPDSGRPFTIEGHHINCPEWEGLDETEIIIEEKPPVDKASRRAELKRRLERAHAERDSIRIKPQEKEPAKEPAKPRRRRRTKKKEPANDGD